MPASKPEIIPLDNSQLAMVTTQVRYSWKISKALRVLAKADCPFTFKPIGHIEYNEDVVPVAEFTYPAELEVEIKKIAAPKLLECHDISYDQAVEEIVDGFRSSIEDDTAAMEETINEGNYPMDWYSWPEAQEAEFAYAEVWEDSPETIRVFWAKSNEPPPHDIFVE